MNDVIRNIRAAGTCALLCLAAACGPSVSEGTTAGDGNSSTAAAASSTGGPSDTSPSVSSAPDPSLSTVTVSTGEDPTATLGVTTDDTNGTSDSDACFLCPPDMGTYEQCDLFMQDCPRGEKCSPWANDGGNSWNATKCVPLDAQPDAPGEPCTVEGSAVSGVDSCDGTSMCFNVDSETNMGECQAFCQGSPEEPTCEPGNICQISGDGVLSLCLPTCDPTVPTSCDSSDVCVPQSGTFVCVVATELDGAFLDPCEFLNACDAGLLCISPKTLDGCEGDSGCCTPYCTLENPDCPGTTACTAYFEEGEAPEGLEHVGVCSN